MPENEPTSARSQRLQVAAFRILGLVMFVLALFGLTVLAVGIFTMFQEKPQHLGLTLGWLILTGAVIVLVGLIGLRAWRVRTVEEVAAEGATRWFDFDATSKPPESNTDDRGKTRDV